MRENRISLGKKKKKACREKQRLKAHIGKIREMINKMNKYRVKKCLRIAFDTTPPPKNFLLLAFSTLVFLLVSLLPL